MKKTSIIAFAAATGLLAVTTTASAFETNRCAACHAIDHDDVGPSWQEVAQAYGSEASLAKAFESGFSPENRAIAGHSDRWKAKAGLMSMQFRHLIKGHEKAAAHALFQSVTNGRFDDYAEATNAASVDVLPCNVLLDSIKDTLKGREADRSDFQKYAKRIEQEGAKSGAANLDDVDARNLALTLFCSKNRHLIDDVGQFFDQHCEKDFSGTEALESLSSDSKKTHETACRQILNN